MKKIILSAVLLWAFGAHATQVILGDAEMSPKVTAHLTTVFGTPSLPELKIYNCHGIKNEKGQFGTCFFNFAAEGSATDNTYIYYLRQNGTQDYVWIGHTNRNEKH